MRRVAAFAVLAACASVGCGQQAPEHVAATRAPIVGGTLDTTDTGVAALLVQPTQGDSMYFLCSGSLLTRNLMLTAHHCVAPVLPDIEHVDCSSSTFGDVEDPSTMLVSIDADLSKPVTARFPVADVWVPPGDDGFCGHDVALVLLAGTGVPAALATPIEPDLTTPPAAGDALTAVGYGERDPDDPTSTGQRMSAAAEVRCVGAGCATDLLTALGATVTDADFLANSPICGGDSGGPALDTDRRVKGVTSRGPHECRTGVYGGIAAWHDFIVEKTFVAATKGHYLPPAWAGDVPADFDPFGASCSGDCPGAFKCWSEGDTSSGICVPECDAVNATCPDDFSCDVALGACVKNSEDPPAHDGRGCSVAPAGSPQRGQAASLVLAGLAAALTLLSRLGRRTLRG